MLKAKMFKKPSTNSPMTPLLPAELQVVKSQHASGQVCLSNIFSLKVNKTNELIIGFRKGKSAKKLQVFIAGLW